MTDITPPPPAAPVRPARLPLGKTSRRLSFERRVRIWLTLLSLPSVGLTAALVFGQTSSLLESSAAVLAVAAAWAFACSFLLDQIIRPLQTLANVVAALREDDFSFRARGGRRGDSLGDLALEINALASTLQHQRTSAQDALTLVERVLTFMQSPVLVFDQEGHIRLLNAAARTAFSLPQGDLTGLHAARLQLASLLTIADQGLYPSAAASAETPRWSVGRAAFRLQGVAHTLLVLSDVTAALREEERTAWRRLIRVLSHEINNSLTPIKSIAGSLRTRLLPGSRSAVESSDLLRGLEVIENRSASLSRFLQGYQRLLRLPPPSARPVPLAGLLSQVAQLETRLQVRVEAGPQITVQCDPDLIQQALINLIQNAADAALSVHGQSDRSGSSDPSEPSDPSGPSREQHPVVSIRWTVTDAEVTIAIEDNGPGIANPGNLFVPFYTTKPQGSGIGLVLAQQVAQAHGGSVSLHPLASGSGTRAELRFAL